MNRKPGGSGSAAIAACRCAGAKSDAERGVHVVRLGLAALERRRLQPELVEHAPLQLQDPLGAADDVEEDHALELELRVPAEDELERLDARRELVEVVRGLAEVALVRLLDRHVRLQHGRARLRAPALVQLDADRAHEVVRVVRDQRCVAEPHGASLVSRAVVRGDAARDTHDSRRTRMAELTTLEAKLGEVTGLAMAAQDLTKKVSRLVKEEGEHGSSSAR